MMLREMLVVGVVMAVSMVGRQVEAQQAAAPAYRVKIIRDLEYAKVGEKSLTLDLYLPEGVPGKLPVIIGIHGGGWAEGSKNGGMGSWLSRYGFAVAVINYRLSGEAIFPAQIQDCKASVRWLRAHADEYQLDPDRFGATGHSAGGHLVSLLATTGDVKEFDVGENLEFSSRIQAAAPSAGPTDLLKMDDHLPVAQRVRHNAPSSPESRLIGGPIQDNPEKAGRANPISYLSETTPPFLLIHGDQDQTVHWSQAKLLFDALKNKKIWVHFHTVKGGGHMLGGPEIQTRTADFFEEHLKGQTKSRVVAAELSESSASSQTPPARSRPAAGSVRGPAWDVVIQRNDANGDGKLSREEFPLKNLFDRIDANGDGFVTKQEDESFRKQ